MAVKIVIDLTRNSQNIDNNTTNVTVKVNAVWSGWSWNALEKPGWLIVDGTKYTFTHPFNIGKTESGSCNLYTKTLDIKHESDGTKTLVLSASYTSGVSSGTVGASASVTLPTINRKSTMSISGTGALDQPQTFTIAKADPSAQHKITYACGSASGTVLVKSSQSSAKWYPPASLAAQNTTGNAVTITYTLYTYYSGTSSVGSTTYKRTYTIPASVVPSCTVSVSDGKGYAPTYNGYIQGHSTFKIAVGAAGIYGSTIRSYEVKANGSVYTTKDVTTAPIKNSGSNTISVEVTDSRGRKATATYTATVLPYSPPKITAMRVARSSDNSKLELTYSYSVSIDGVISGEVAYKKTTETNYTTINLDVNGEHTVSFAAAEESSYDVILTINDPFASTSKARVGPSAYKLFSIHKKGNGWAFGKRAEEEEAVDHGWKTYHRDSAYFDPNKKIYGKTADGVYMNTFEPVNDNGNTVIGYGHYDKGAGQTNIYGHDLLFGVSNVGTRNEETGVEGITYRPYLRQGDEFTVLVQTAGYVTNGKKDVTFMVPLSRPIIGSPIVTVSSNEGFTLRQGGNYVYNWTGTTEAYPDSYSCSGTYTYGIKVTAHFSVESDSGNNVADVTNNDTIGVLWSGKITLSEEE